MRCNLRHHILLCFVRGNPTLCCLAWHPLWQCRDVVCCGVLYCTVPWSALRCAALQRTRPRGSASDSASSCTVKSECQLPADGGSTQSGPLPLQSNPRPARAATRFPRLLLFARELTLPFCVSLGPKSSHRDWLPYVFYVFFFFFFLLSGGLFRLVVVELGGVSG